MTGAALMSAGRTRSARLIVSPVSFAVLAVFLVSNPLLCRPASAQAAEQVTAQAQAPADDPVPPSNAPAASGGADRGAERGAVADLSPQEPAGFTYTSQGRRDPFVSLVGQGVGADVSARPAGLAGLGVDEVTLRDEP